jgi:5,5'-dehydrodivanillate O-demethylase
MRRYWHPFIAAVMLEENPVQRVRLLGEDLVLYKDRSGTLGLIGDRCAHRSVHMEYGIPEEDGLRCPYHGWLYNESGQCTEMPLEPPGYAFKEKVTIKSYPVQEMGGLIWAYMGPSPVPLLPQWDLFVREDGFREIVGHQLPCNWLQCMENRGDLGHGIYLHGRLFQYALERKGELNDDPSFRWNASMIRQNEKLQQGVYTKWRPVYNEFGFSKGQMDSTDSEDALSWQLGSNPILFPYHLAFTYNANPRIRRWYQIGVPIDDYNTWHMTYYCWSFPAEIGVEKQTSVPYTELPLRDETGSTVLDYVLSQDMVAWYSQGPLVDRGKEHLATSDACVIAYRKLLKEQITLVAQGEEPMNVFWDSEKAWRPELRIPCMQESSWANAPARNQSNATARRPGGYEGPYVQERVALYAEADRFFQTRPQIEKWLRQAEELFEQQQPVQAPPL